MTLNKDGKANKIALTTVLIPSYLETNLSGLKALKALNPLAKERSIFLTEESIQVIILNKTIMKSSRFQSSFK